MATSCVLVLMALEHGKQVLADLAVDEMRKFEEIEGDVETANMRKSKKKREPAMKISGEHRSMTALIERRPVE